MKKLRFRKSVEEIGKGLRLNESQTLEAFTILTYSEYKLWIVLLFNEDGDMIPISPAMTKGTIDMNDSSYYRAIDGLIQKGFLRQVKTLTDEDYSKFVYEGKNNYYIRNVEEDDYIVCEEGFAN